MNSNTVPHIDLHNFENEQFRNSEYVLTSPLSLQACQNLHIRPSDLLRSVDESSVNTADKEQLEKQRKLQILKARIERQRLVNELSEGRHNLAVEGRHVRRARDQQIDQNSERDPHCLVNDPPMDTPLTPTQRFRKSSIPDNGKPNSLVRELQFHRKRTELEETAKREIAQRRMTMESRLSRAERNKNEIQRRRYMEMENRRRTFEKKAINVSHRRKQLEEEISIYYRELERFQNMTLRKAEEKINQKLQYEQAKIQSEREYKELINKHNRELIEEEVVNKSYEMMARIEDKNRQNEQFMQEKLQKIIESRCFANEAQKVREEIRKIYNLDSFDKKANYVEIVNHVIK